MHRKAGGVRGLSHMANMGLIAFFERRWRALEASCASVRHHS